MDSKIIPVSDFRKQTRQVMRQVKEGEVVYITQHGRPAAVLLDYETYEQLVALARQQMVWPSDYFAETYGALAADPLERPPQPDFEQRDDVD